MLRLQANESYINDQLTQIVKDCIDIDIQGQPDSKLNPVLSQSLSQASQHQEVMKQRMKQLQDLQEAQRLREAQHQKQMLEEKQQAAKAALLS